MPTAPEGAPRILPSADGLDPAGFRTDAGGPIACLGTFDGVHLGHRAVLEQLTAWARREGRLAVAVTFHRHPLEVLRGRGPGRITPLRTRLCLLARSGPDRVVGLRFDRALAETPARAFAESLFVRRLGAAGVLTGHDHRFGRDREGDTDLLRAVGSEHGFDVREAAVEPAPDGGELSSSAVREAIRAGDVERAADLLGRPHGVVGRVVHGAGRGAGLGFPTANLQVRGALMPPRGVWAGRARRLDGDGPRDLRPAVANLGLRPTFGGDVESLEVHLLDDSPDLRGAWLEFRFLEHLRGERRFDGPDALAEAIGRDCERARDVLARRPPAGA